MTNITQIFLTKEIFMNSSMLGMDFKEGERNEKKRKKIALIIKVVNSVSVGVSFFQLEWNVSVLKCFSVPFRGCTVHTHTYIQQI
jgi:hypothetical protein